MDLRKLFENLESKFRLEPVVLKDDSKKIMLVGDIHGDLDTVEFIKKNLDNYDKVICLGDYIDRGIQDIQVSKEIAKLKLENDNFILLPGNHDICFGVDPRDWTHRLAAKFGGEKAKKISYAYIKAFQNAPLAYHNTHYKLFAVHGFIPVQEKYWDIKQWPKPEIGILTLFTDKEGRPFGDKEVLDPAFQIVWNDPEEANPTWINTAGKHGYGRISQLLQTRFSSEEDARANGYLPPWEACPKYISIQERLKNPRGPGMYTIPCEKTLEFMKQNELDTIVRSHMPQINKVFKLEDKCIVNIGSAAHYGKKGVYILPKGIIKKI